MRFGGEPLHEQKRSVGVFGVFGNQQTQAAGLRSALDAARVQRPAHIAHHLAAGRVVDHARQRSTVQVHGGLALQEGGVGLALAVAGDARWAGGHHVLQKLQRSHAGFVVKARLPLVVKNRAAKRIQVQQPRVYALVPGLSARSECPNARLVFEHAQCLAEILIGLGHFEVELGKNIAAVSQHGGLCTIGQAIQLGTRPRQVALGATDQAEVLQINRDDVLHVVGWVGQRGIGKERLQRKHQILGDVFALPHHDVAGQVVVALGLGHFQQLLFFQAANGQLVHLHFDARLFGELGQQLGHRVVMRVRRNVDGDGLAAVFGVAVLRDGTAVGQARTKHGDGGVFHQVSALHELSPRGG